MLFKYGLVGLQKPLCIVLPDVIQFLFLFLFFYHFTVVLFDLYSFFNMTISSISFPENQLTHTDPQGGERERGREGPCFRVPKIDRTFGLIACLELICGTSLSDPQSPGLMG